MYLPMKQVIVFVSIRKGDNVPDEELIDYIFEKRNVQNAEAIWWKKEINLFAVKKPVDM